MVWRTTFVYCRSLSSPNQLKAGTDQTSEVSALLKRLSRWGRVYRSRREGKSTEVPGTEVGPGDNPTQDTVEFESV